VTVASPFHWQDVSICNYKRYIWHTRHFGSLSTPVLCFTVILAVPGLEIGESFIIDVHNQKDRFWGNNFHCFEISQLPLSVMLHMRTNSRIRFNICRLMPGPFTSLLLLLTSELEHLHTSEGLFRPPWWHPGPNQLRFGFYTSILTRRSLRQFF
jgi:hypothetical protein